MRVIQGDTGKKLGIHYEYDPTDKPLGEGGMGVVFRGWRFEEYTGLQREVAIKVLNPGLPQHVIIRARREASVQIRNENLIEMIDFVEVKSKDELGTPITKYYVISEFLHGVTLDALLNGKVTDYKGEVIPFARELYGKYLNNSYLFALTIIRSLLSGLMALHDAGYIHRDIDPSNIMITADGHIKLIDFGISKKISGPITDDTSYTQIGQFIGKPKYAAPELVRGLSNSLAIPTDLYAVGILLYQLITGHVPFDGEMAEILEMQLNNKLPLKNIKQKALRNIIKKATQKNKDKRFQSAAEFRVAIDKLFPLPYPQRELNFVKVNMVAAILIVLIGFFWWILTKAPELDTNNITEIEQSEKNSTIFNWGIDKPKEENDDIKYNKALVMLKNADTAQEGLSLLNNLKNSSSDNIRYNAVFLLSRLYFKNKVDSLDVPDSIRHMQQALIGIISIDNKKAHQYLIEATTINNNDYHSLYELGCNYMSSGKRGTNKDLKKAKEYLEKAQTLAKTAKDKEYIEKTRIKLALLK